MRSITFPRMLHYAALQFSLFAFAFFFSQLAPQDAMAQHSEAEQTELGPEVETLALPIVAPSDSGVYAHINEIPEGIRRSRPFAREYYEMARQAGSSGTIDHPAYFSAFKEAQQNALRTSEASLKSKHNLQDILSGTWVNIEATTVDTGKTGGCTVAIAFDPKNTNIM
jgi:hypothetical protein